jgi:hypothetical protein
MRTFSYMATLALFIFGASHAEANQACFYDEQNYGGDSFCLQEGTTINNLNGSGWQDRISSIAVWGGVDVLVCDDANFGNPCATIRNHQPSLNHFGLEGRISSIRVSNGFNNNPPPPPPPSARACFYDGNNLDGEGFCVNRGQRVDNLGGTAFNDRVSSMYVPRNTSVRVCEHRNFGGRCSDFRSGSYDLSQYLFDNMMSSIEVY